MQYHTLMQPCVLHETLLGAAICNYSLSALFIMCLSNLYNAISLCPLSLWDILKLGWSQQVFLVSWSERTVCGASAVQIADANLPLPICHRTTPHGQLTMGGQKESQVGKQVDWQSGVGSSGQGFPFSHMPWLCWAPSGIGWWQRWQSGWVTGRQWWLEASHFTPPVSTSAIMLGLKSSMLPMSQ